MSEYKLKVKLANDDVVEIVVANAVITVSKAPASYTDYEYDVVTQLLRDYMPMVATANMKSIEIEKES